MKYLLFSLFFVLSVHAQWIDRTVSAPDEKQLMSVAKNRNFFFKATPDIALKRPFAVNSKEYISELEYILSKQGSLKAEELWNLNYENTGFAEMVVNATGAARKPLTINLVHMVKHDAAIALAACQIKYKRFRPYQVADNIFPGIVPEPTYAYPAANPAMSLICLLTIEALAEKKLPDGKKVLDAMARRRINAALEAPSDLVAGEIFAQEFFNQLITSESFQARFKIAKSEWKKD